MATKYLLGARWRGISQLSLAIAIGIVESACSDAKSLYAEAEKSRKAEDYQLVIEKFPDSSEAGLARDRIVDLEQWASSRGSLEKKDYQAYLGAHPKGVFASDAAKGLSDLEAAEKARGEDTLEACNAYLAGFPDGLAAESFRQRAAELGSVEPEYQRAAASDDAEVIRDSALALEGRGYAGYSVALWRRAEDLAGREVLGQLRRDRRFEELGDLASVDTLLPDLPAKQRLLAREARERIAVARVAVSEGRGRFAIPIEVEIGSAARFSIAAKSDPPALRDRRNRESQRNRVTSEIKGSRMRLGRHGT